MNFESSMVQQARPGAMYKGGVMSDMGINFNAATTGPAQAEATVRQDFADVAYCAVIQTGADGRATTTFKVPEAITAYRVEAFALGPDGREWAHASESLEVNQPLWAEFKLPAFVYPGDFSPAVLEVNCSSGKFSLKLLCDNQPVDYKLTGAQRVNADFSRGSGRKCPSRPGRDGGMPNCKTYLPAKLIYPSERSKPWASSPAWPAAFKCYWPGKAWTAT